MTTPLFIAGIKRRWLPFWRRHQVLIVFLFVLSLIAGSSRFLRGSILDPPKPVSDFFEAEADPRVCSSTGTVFMNLQTLQEATDMFQKRMSTVVGEHEGYLKTPSSWECTGEGGGISALTQLAKEMPGWYYVPADGDPKLLPVTFASFASVISEFEREYECKLMELDRDAKSIVAINGDLDDPKLFCCDAENNSCVQATLDVNCTTTLYEDSLCQGACPTNNTFGVYARLDAFEKRINDEKERARVALLRTLHALRSLDLSFAYAKQLVCFQRASLDLKNELALLADTISCMPKIWDAVTSLHDSDDSLIPE